MASVYNKDPFHNQEVRLMFENTQAVPDDQLPDGDKYINMVLLYLFRKARVELKAFHNAATLAKIDLEVDGVIISKGRILEGMEFLETASLTWTWVLWA